MKENEKLISFMLLGAGVLILTCLVMYKTPENDAALRIVDAAVGGLLLALGAAANAIFRQGTQGEEAMRAAASELVNKNTPQQTVVVNDKKDPIPVEGAPGDDYQK